MVAPMQVDTCSLELLRDSLAAARARGLKMTVHCSQHIRNSRRWSGGTG